LGRGNHLRVGTSSLFIERGIEVHIDEEDTFIEAWQYADIYMAIARIGEPKLWYKKVDSEYLNIGGYGLFYE
jgi:hypothetical protein